MTTRLIRAERRLATRAIGTFLAAGMCAPCASAADIFVPLDVPTIEAAVAIAADGDSIFVVDEDLLEDVVFTDLGGKAISVFSGIRKSPDAFSTREGSLWLLPDGSRLVGSDLSVNGAMRVRDDANAIIDTSFFGGTIDIRRSNEPLAAILEIGEGAGLDLIAETVEVRGRVRLREHSRLFGYGSSFDLWNGGSIVLSDGSRLSASSLSLFDNPSSLVADNAEIDIGYLYVGDDGSRFEMRGGRLTVETLSVGSPSTNFSLYDADLTILGDPSLSASRLVAGTVIRGGTVTASTELQIESIVTGDPSGPGGVVLEGVEIASPLLTFEEAGETRFSGEVFGGAMVRGDLLVLGDSTFYGPVENSATITVLEGELAFLGGLENNGSIIVVGGEERDATPRTVRVLSKLIVRPARSLVLGTSDRLMVRGDLEIQTTLGRGSIGLAGATVEILPGAGNASGFEGESVEAVGADLGPSDRGFNPDRPDTAPIGELIVRNGVQALVADRVPNTEGPGALYADTVRVDSGGTLRVAEGTAVYCRTLIAEGTLETPERVVLIGSCEADLAAPFGIVDLADITAFVSGFTTQMPKGDLAQPYGVFDLNDISVFVSAFLAPCD